MPESTTEILAAIFGLFFVVGGLRMITDAGSVRQLTWEFHSNGALTLLAGAVVLVMGAVVVALHNDWSWWLAAAVSGLGWITLAKGVLLLLLPRAWVGIFAGMRIPVVVISVFGLVAAGAGAVLLWGAFMADGAGLGDLFNR